MLTALATARAFLKRVPAWVWIAIALVALWAWERDNHADNREAKTRAEMQAEIDAADRERAKALASEEEAIKALAKRTDSNVEQARAANRDRTERFIASGGLQCPTARSGDAARGSAGSSAPVHQAPVLDGTQPVQVVGVTAEDVRICTDNTLKAEALRDYALGLEKPAE
jgi:hypothetical protein